MYKEYYEKYINSAEYLANEQDLVYKRMMDVLRRNLSELHYLHTEELFHAEILLKTELAFREGFRYGKQQAGG